MLLETIDRFERNDHTSAVVNYTSKTALVNSQVLAYPNFSTAFTLETDASIKGLGAILSQMQDDNRLHPVAYGSISLSTTEKQHGITDLETLESFPCISVWQRCNSIYRPFRHPSPSTKHARWWNKEYASGVCNVKLFTALAQKTSSQIVLSYSSD